MNDKLQPETLEQFAFRQFERCGGDHVAFDAPGAETWDDGKDEDQEWPWYYVWQACHHYRLGHTAIAVIQLCKAEQLPQMPVTEPGHTGTTRADGARIARWLLTWLCGIETGNRSEPRRCNLHKPLLAGCLRPYAPTSDTPPSWHHACDPDSLGASP